MERDREAIPWGSAIAWYALRRDASLTRADPNELMALLQVYPWHVDTLLSMSEVYRLQSGTGLATVERLNADSYADIGTASDYAERALYAFDRCLIPTFSVSSGASRLDFDRVENRPMFMALHRIIS